MAGAAAIQAMIDRYFPPHTHPYQVLRRKILDHLEPSHTVLEIGCGRTAPNLLELKGRAEALIGIDLVEFVIADPEIRLLNADVCSMSVVATESIDLAYSRSVMEHIEDVQSAYSEISRVLRPGGKYIFLTPNAWDYASIAAYLVPNRFHAAIVRIVEGRKGQDVFPTHYRSNTVGKIKKISKANSFSIEFVEYLGQYPSYLTFNASLFYIGCQYGRFLERNQRFRFLKGWILCVLSKIADTRWNPSGSRGKVPDDRQAIRSRCPG
jgi:SAM-dependent methyltransferase